MSDLNLHNILYLMAFYPELPLAFAAGSLLLGGTGWWVAPRWGWAQAPTALAGCSLALVLAATLVRPIGMFPPGGLNPVAVVRECVVGSLSLARTYEKLNVLLLMPFAFFATLATRRPVIVAACCLLATGAVELLQGATGSGACQLRDVLHNIGGGVIGVLLAVMTLRFLLRRPPGITPVSGSFAPDRGTTVRYSSDTR
ncbi:MAG: VanZ family protein [Pseudonocardiaceae bacterium]